MRLLSDLGPVYISIIDDIIKTLSSLCIVKNYIYVHIFQIILGRWTLLVTMITFTRELRSYDWCLTSNPLKSRSTPAIKDALQKVKKKLG